MSLTPEDTLRINVLLANKPLALRIDESRMQLLALMADDEICVPLNPDCRDEVYVRKLRELISGHVLGSPGGYPIYLKRWTRMGQMRDESLQELLLLAEPEAVMAVVCAAGLTDELARRAWWSVENAEHARRMLKNRQVVDGEMGSILADYLMEYLPFESEAENIMEDVRLILQKGLIPAEKRLDLWEKSSRKTAYYIGFLLSDPNNLPMQKAESSLWQPCADLLQQVALEKNQTAQVLLRALSAEGQAFISTCQLVLKKPANQEVVCCMLDLIAAYFSATDSGIVEELTIAELQQKTADFMLTDEAVDLINLCPQQAEKIRKAIASVHFLSAISYAVIRPLLRDSTAIGSLMRRKLEPALSPIQNQLENLLQ